MTTLDNFFEKCKSKMNKIKHKSIRDAIRGFLLAVDLPGFAIEGLKERESILHKSPSEFYTLFCRNMAGLLKDHKENNSATLLVPVGFGSAVGASLSVYTHGIPWLVVSLIDLTNLYLRRKQNVNKRRQRQLFRFQKNILSKR